LLFLEHREDLLGEASERRGPVLTRTRLHGLSARGPEPGRRLAHVADPGPETAAPLMAAAISGHSVSALAASRAPEPPASASGLEDRAASTWLGRALEAASRGAAVAAVSARWVGFDQEIRVAAREGQVRDRRRGRRGRLEIWVCRGERTGHAVGEALLGNAGIDPQSLACRVVDRATLRLEAVAAPRGDRPVVFAAGVGGVLIHEIVGHALEADTVIEGSWITQLEKSIGPEWLTVVDDPRRGRAPWRVDDEGAPASATLLVRRGRVAGQLHDRASARRAGRMPTGHGRRSSYREPVRPRMGCTYVMPGKHDPEEIVRETGDGIYVRRMESATVDPRSGRAVFRVTDSDRIRNGRIDAPLREHLLIVEARRALASMDRIADDLSFDTCIGSCHRDAQPLAISVGTPTLRVGLATVPI
jgi:TldD protein